MNYKSIFFVCLLISLLPFKTFSQDDKEIDSMRKVIKQIPENDKVKKALALLSLGQQYVTKSNFTSSTDCYQQSLAIAQGLKNDSLVANCYRHLAVIAFYQHDNYKDSLYSFTALKIYRRINDRLNQGKLSKNIGAYYLQKGDTTNSKKYYEQAISIFKQLNNQRLLAGVYSNLAVFYKGHYRKSIELELAAKKIWDKYPTGDVLPLANLGNLGVNYFYMVKDDSLKSIRPDSLISASPSKNLKKAEEYIREAIKIAKQRNDAYNQAYYTKVLSELQYYKGDYKNAYLNADFYQKINDSIFSQENKNKIAELESRNEIQKKNQEILAQKLRVQSQQRNILLLVAGLSIMLIIGALFYRLSIIRKQQNKELTALNQQLDDANKLKAKFFAILTHDLRSPISSLVNFFQLQKRAPLMLNEEQKAEQESKITKSALSLLEVMEGILLWSKGQMENFKPEKTNVYAADLFSHLKDFFSGVTYIKFNYYTEEGLTFYTDENYLKTIMHNLTQNSVNALKQTPYAIITWKAWKENDQLKLSITDNGPGMSEEQIKKFEENTTVSSSKQGLGLHLIKDMAQIIGCTIIPGSNEAGGATFVLTIDSLINV